MSRDDLRLLGKVALISLGVVVYGLTGAGLALAFMALVGWLFGLAVLFVYCVLTMFVWVKIDERRGGGW